MPKEFKVETTTKRVVEARPVQETPSQVIRVCFQHGTVRRLKVTSTQPLRRHWTCDHCFLERVYREHY